MYKRPDEKDEEPLLEELIELAELELMHQNKRGKGSAKVKLEKHRTDITTMLKKRLPVPIMRELLARVGTEVNIKSLFKYLREDMPSEYAEYLAITGRGKKENRNSKSTIEETHQSALNGDLEEANIKGMNAEHQKGLLSKSERRRNTDINFDDYKD